MDKYTTLEKLDKLKGKPEEAEEKTKTILSNDAFAICDFIDNLKREIGRR